MNGEQGHILVVDDHRTNRLKLSLGLKQQGHTVAEAENGRQALDILRTQSFDLVLLDILMPEMDGYQVLEQMKNDSALRDVPVIVISAQDELESVVKGIELGAQDYLPKSFDPVLLRARIGACLEKKRLRDQSVKYLARIEKEKSRSEKLLNIVIPIGVALSTEKDFNRLLEKVLLEAMLLCNADGGTLYLRTERDTLEFVLMHNKSLNMALGGATGNEILFAPLHLYDANGQQNNNHIAVCVALDGQAVNLRNAYQTKGLNFSGLMEFDRMLNYRSQSCLTIPLKNSASRVTGVLQLINAQDSETGGIIPFDEYLQQLIESLSSLAAVALDVYSREQNLRSQIEQLRIEIDDARQSRQVAEITESDYFRRLESEAEDLRKLFEEDGVN